MIEQARRKYPAICFATCDARELPFSDEFDAVFSNAALHWIPEADAVVAGIARSLRPAGRFVAELGGQGNISHLMESFAAGLMQMGVSPEGASPWFYPSITDYSALLERHGLEVRKALLFERPTKLDDGERGLANWIRMFGDSYVRRVPEAKRDAYVRSVEEFARPSLWKSSHWELDYRRLRVVARKSLT